MPLYNMFDLSYLAAFLIQWKYSHNSASFTSWRGSGLQIAIFYVGISCFVEQQILSALELRETIILQYNLWIVAAYV